MRFVWYYNTFVRLCQELFDFFFICDLESNGYFIASLVISIIE